MAANDGFASLDYCFKTLSQHLYKVLLAMSSLERAIHTTLP